MSFELPFKLPTGWQVATVDELVKQKIIAKPLDGNHGGIHPKASDYIESGVPFVMASDLAGGRVDLIDCKFISEEQASGLRKGIAKAGDVLLSHKATIGRTAIVQDSKHDFIMLTPQVTYYRVINSSALSNIYLKAYFDSRFFQSILGLWAGAGSTRAYLGITGQLKLPIILPPIEIQNEISGQVHALNKKVNLNNEINQTLEEMAQAIFKSWFVDFDPVKAKMNGKQPEGMDAATASLFPEKLVESELGLIPEGWDVGTLSDVAKYCSARTKTDTITLENYISTENMLAEKKGVTAASKLPTAKTVAAYKSGDILVSNIRPYFKKIWLAEGSGGRSNDVLGFESVSANTESYLMNLLYQDTFFEYMTRTSKGAKMPRGDKTAIMNWEMAVPPVELREAFSAIVDKFYQLIPQNRAQNATLESLRDTLLPKLLSGELSLTDSLEVTNV
ncbi:restriction endonuclease subunit S [Vibrio parahaemolyticus]|uniref:restriction endonuclease subunit S n=1 Tax=Vibrio parahaemolyticus TaxID=670 RepID=UPI001F2EC543|nr:restriction endonuclease subunit S [Vibrio parahaemolyticus]MCG0013930.1 restriction endonuclease subunit S [Vibrio parahaemolyticus]MDL1999493.1 restriction endonuclease subunit S [Vibrio parahaemolyticus]